MVEKPVNAMSLSGCLLCSHDVLYFADTRQRNYYRCTFCESVILDPSDRLSYQDEQQRYRLHQNNLEDRGYLEFLSPLITAVSNDFNENNHGLDYGSGPTPVVTLLLRENKFEVTPYDPFFCNDTEALTRRYDFIICSETVEHFHNPLSEFERLRSLLNPNGKLFMLTALYDDSVDFINWHYKNDPTHVFFYSTKAFEYIRSSFNFKSVSFNGRLIVLSS